MRFWLAAASLAALVLVMIPAQLPAEGESEAQTLFVDTHKCSMCHSIASAGVERKSDKMKGSDLGGYSTDDAAALGKYLRKEEQRDGEDHKRSYKGTDEELQTILDWLATLEAAEEG